MIKVDFSFVIKFIQNNLSNILKFGNECKNDINNASLSDNEVQFCTEICDKRKKLIKMTKKKMKFFVKMTMKRMPFFKKALEIKKLHITSNLKEDKINFINQLNNDYGLSIPENYYKNNVEEIKQEAYKQLDFDIEKVYAIIKKMFDYNSFYECKDNKISLACQFVLDSKLTCCPYCNRAFIETYDENKRTATLDHYYPQSLYPFFAISPWNLVPCCYYCNKVKLNPDTMENPHIYPYELKDSHAICFKIVPENKFDFSESEEIEIKLEPSVGKKLEEAEQSINTFHLNQLYKNNKKTAYTIYELIRLKDEIFLDRVAHLFEKYDDETSIKKELIAIRDYMIMPYGEDGILGKLSKDTFEHFIKINK